MSNTFKEIIKKGANGFDGNLETIKKGMKRALIIGGFTLTSLTTVACEKNYDGNDKKSDESKKEIQIDENKEESNEDILKDYDEELEELLSNKDVKSEDIKYILIKAVQIKTAKDLEIDDYNALVPNFNNEDMLDGTFRLPSNYEEALKNGWKSSEDGENQELAKENNRIFEQAMIINEKTNGEYMYDQETVEEINNCLSEIKNIEGVIDNSTVKEIVSKIRDELGIIYEMSKEDFLKTIESSQAQAVANWVKQNPDETEEIVNINNEYLDLINRINESEEEMINLNSQEANYLENLNNNYGVKTADVDNIIENLKEKENQKEDYLESTDEDLDKEMD